MRLLILGVTGMLGHTLHRVFAPDPRFETWATLRATSGKRHFPEATHARLLVDVDVLSSDALIATLERVRPDVVINAVGIVKQLASADDPLVALPTNALLPHRLARACALANARCILVSTDCVFSGARGGYTEADRTDADDLYGISKALGEVHDMPNAITLRTSGIGHELGSRLGLIEWFLGAAGPVRGFRRAVYSGLPWVTLAEVIRDHVLPRPELHGLYHVSSDPINKYALLQLVAAAYGKDIEIVPDDAVMIDRSLSSERFRSTTGWRPAPWTELVAQMNASHHSAVAA